MLFTTDIFPYKPTDSAVAILNKKGHYRNSGRLTIACHMKKDTAAMLNTLQQPLLIHDSPTA
jgi:hypothetical protein